LAQAGFEEAARRFADHGPNAIGRGRNATAREAFSTAALCFHYATCVPGGDRMAIGAILQQAAQAHRAALTAAGRPFAGLVLSTVEGAIVLSRACKDVAPLRDSARFLRQVAGQEMERWAGRRRSHGGRRSRQSKHLRGRLNSVLKSPHRRRP
jgi:hypothetical protein